MAALVRVLRQAQHVRVLRPIAKTRPRGLNMSKATHAACLSLLLTAGCGEGDGSGAQSADTPDTAAGDASPGAGVSCATGGAQTFSNACTVEQAQVEGAPILVIRHADGGFRRLAVKDGSVAEADGAEKAIVTRTDNTIEVAIGSDRYRLDAGLVSNGQ